MSEKSEIQENNSCQCYIVKNESNLWQHYQSNGIPSDKFLEWQEFYRDEQYNCQGNVKTEYFQYYSRKFSAYVNLDNGFENRVVPNKRGEE